MNDQIISIRNKLFHLMYTKILKPIFFTQDPENVHDMMASFGQILGRYTFTKKLTSIFFSYSNPMLEQNIHGIHFSNPVGLAAGFDKDAMLTDIMPQVGFGFMEVGSITGKSSKGNPKPRLWRLKKSKALVVYTGLKNRGCEKISERLRRKEFTIPIGTNIAKTNCFETVETDAGIEDYVKAFRHFTDIGSYFTINISCPNAYGGEPFTDPNKLDKLLSAIDGIRTNKPIFLKLSPDMTEKQVEGILAICERHRVHGFLCTNLTKKRNSPKILDENVPETGGISGKVVEDLSTDQVHFIYQKTKGKYVIIGCGGIFSAEDAYKKIKAGASLVQLITGMIFEGPQIISEINQGLVKLLKKDGFKNIAEACGAESSSRF